MASKPLTLATLKEGDKHTVKGLEMTFSHWSPEGHPSFFKVWNGYSTHYENKNWNVTTPMSELR